MCFSPKPKSRPHPNHDDVKMGSANERVIMTDSQRELSKWWRKRGIRVRFLTKICIGNLMSYDTCNLEMSTFFLGAIEDR